MRPVPRCLLALALLVSASVSAGCTSGSDGTEPRGEDATKLPDDAPPPRNVTLEGRVADARSGAPLANASVTVEIVTGHPCAANGTRLAWHTWALDVDPDGRFGPLHVAAPRGNASFQFRVTAPDHVPRAVEHAFDPARDTRVPAVQLDLLPAGNVTLPAPEGALVAWWVPGNAHAFEATRHAGPVVTATGPVAGAFLDADGRVVPWRADVRADRVVNATVSDPVAFENATDVTVAVRSAATGRAEAAIVVGVDASGAVVALADVADDATARLRAPADRVVTLHAVAPAPVAARGSVDAWAPDAVVTVPVASPACPRG